MEYIQTVRAAKDGTNVTKTLQYISRIGADNEIVLFRHVLLLAQKSKDCA